MAAKEEAAVLKYLKKNPAQEALDISFAIDIDENLIKEALVSLEGKGQVESKDVGGRPQWSIAAPKPKVAAPAAAPAPAASAGDAGQLQAAPAVVAAPKKVKAEPSDESDAPVGGTSKGFVVVIGLLAIVIATGAGYVLGGIQAKAATTALENGQVKLLRDSIGLTKAALNIRLDGLESQIRDLKAAPPAPAAEEAKPAKAAVKPKKKHHH